MPLNFITPLKFLLNSESSKIVSVYVSADLTLSFRTVPYLSKPFYEKISGGYVREITDNFVPAFTILPRKEISRVGGEEPCSVLVRREDASRKRNSIRKANILSNENVLKLYVE